MRTRLIIVLAIALIGSTASPPAGANRNRRVERTEVGEYNAPSPGAMTPVPYAVVTFNCYQGLPEGCVRFTPRRGDRFVSVEVEDQLGQPVYFWIGQREEELEDFCGGKMDEPMRIQPGLDVTVFLIEGTCGGSNTTHSVVTRGTVTATFSNRP